MKPAIASRIYIGTSGWSYPHWKGPFYSRDLPVEEWLGFYAERFRSVEVNNSFYRLPERHTFKSWTQSVPEGFLFSVKASRYITHMKKLREPKRSTRVFLRRVAALGDRLGPILFQLPPRWGFDGPRLESFLKALSGEFRYAFEFRDRGWINDESADLLARHGAAFCMYDLEGSTSPRRVTADFVYVRLHGPAAAYGGSYDASALAGWAGAFSSWAARGRCIYCYFDNDERAHAARNAARLESMVRTR